MPARKNLIIINAGRFGREVFTWATQTIEAGAPYRIKGFLDSRAEALAGFDYEAGILGDVERYEIQDGDVFVGAVGDPRDKVQYYTPIIERGGCFVNIIHPMANIGVNVRLGSGVVVAPFVAVSSDIMIGDHVSILPFTNVGHDSVVGDWCQISSHCGINGHAIIGPGVFLGSHACIVPDRTVGAGAFVGAAAVVVKDVPPHIKVFGNPARPIGRVGPSTAPFDAFDLPVDLQPLSGSLPSPALEVDDSF
jgi:sugar O-acyltransferase (sialic acid O-acetyltransferase NeuD family)